MSFSRRFENKFDEKTMDTETKTAIAAKTASKRVVQKTKEGAGDLIRNKIADKITLLGKTKSKDKKTESKKLHATRKKAANS